MVKEVEIVILPHLLEDEKAIKAIAAGQLGIPVADISSVVALKRSIDARSKQVVYRSKVAVYIKEQAPIADYSIAYKKASGDPIYIIGAGPAGIFAALRLLEAGCKPIIIERGKEIKARRRDLALINKEGIVNTESNYCFGEGGAGTYSDGKLYTRSTKRGDVDAVLKAFVFHGADPDILVNARPHIGTNKLPQIITAMRERILEYGGEILFGTKFTDIKTAFGKIEAIQLNDTWVKANNVILATGHSARDVYTLLYNRGISIEAKPFAMGVRIEHPQELIDKLQYHCDARGPYLPPAYYNIVEQVEGRGVFSFCMCPGGIIAPCATGEKEIVVNGWSPSKRNNPFANSGMAVQIDLEDIKGVDSDPLAGLRWQQEIEQQAYLAGGGALKAPAQRMVDFVQGKVSPNELLTSYLPGTTSVDLQQVLPSFIAKRLKQAFPQFGKKMQSKDSKESYYTNEAILVGVESRTSSPVKIPRDRQTMQHPQVLGLYPCAEGAGYAGGIVSAAIDGILCAEAILSDS